MKDYRLITLSNGIRVVHKYVPSAEIVHAGVFLEIGSRDETETNQGIAHFWEHMAFKGTQRRKAFHIINSLDSVGGELNAYTEKEKVVFYASVRQRYTERAVDVLSDIAFHSTFPEREIEKERGVILEEMSMYRDDPDDSIRDEFDTVVFGKHPLGMNILGRQETVGKFQKKDFVAFIRKHLNTGQVVFSCVGNITDEKMDALARTYLEPVPRRKPATQRKKFERYKPTDQVVTQAITQARCAIGRDAYPIKHKHRIPFHLLVNLLAGPGMNSRLNLVLREKYGLVYAVDASFSSYVDTGLFAIFFGTEPQQLNKCINLVRKELARLCDTPLGGRQLAGLKEQVKGHMSMSEESNLNIMLVMGRSVLDFGSVPSLQQVYNRIDAVEAPLLQDIAQQMFNPKKLSSLIFAPGPGV